MIITLFFNLLVLIVKIIVSWLPSVENLPSIVGYDIDTALVNGVGQLHTVFTAFWPLGLMFQGFLVLLGYYALKMVLKFFIGHRAPQ